MKLVSLWNIWMFLILLFKFSCIKKKIKLNCICYELSYIRNVVSVGKLQLIVKMQKSIISFVGIYVNQSAIGISDTEVYVKMSLTLFKRFSERKRLAKSLRWDMFCHSSICLKETLLHFSWSVLIFYTQLGIWGFRFSTGVQKVPFRPISL